MKVLLRDCYWCCYLKIKFGNENIEWGDLNSLSQKFNKLKIHCITYKISLSLRKVIKYHK